MLAFTRFGGQGNPRSPNHGERRQSPNAILSDGPKDQAPTPHGAELADGMSSESKHRSYLWQEQQLRSIQSRCQRAMQIAGLWIEQAFPRHPMQRRKCLSPEYKAVHAVLLGLSLIHI